jgi:hypothetical protein
MVGVGRARPRRLPTRPVAALLATIVITMACSCAKPDNGSSSVVPAPTPSASSADQASSVPLRRKPGEKGGGPLGVPGEWTLDWRDEFSGTSVNLKR